MKKLLLVLLGLLLAFSLASCGGIPPQQETAAKAYQRGYDDGWEAGYEAAKAASASAYRSSAGSVGSNYSTPRPAATPKPAATARPVATTPPATVTYILNKNTKKFHYPTCSSVGQMKESNKVYFDGTREEVIAMGYDPCGRCHP